MNTLELIIDFHLKMDRQGPGSKEDTLKALSFIETDTQKGLNIADLGCGTGGQTITIAQNLRGSITAIDLFPQFLKELEQRAEKHGIANQIRTVEGSMDQLPFDNEELDIIWSEGAIYNIGFERGIKNWMRFLKPGGFLAISEITWITDTRPKEIEEFWTKEYPEIDTASKKISILEENGFTLSGYFYLGENSWIEHYYKPMEAEYQSFLERNNYSDSAKEVVNEYKSEIELYNNFKKYFSYGFYIARKN